MIEEQSSFMIKGSVSGLAGARVIMVITDFEMGGTERQVLLLAQYLKEVEGAEVEIWGLGTKLGPVADVCDQLRIARKLFPVQWFVPKFRKLRSLAILTWKLRRARPDVILSYLILPNVVCGLIWRWTGARACIWNQRCSGTGRLGRAIEKMATSRVSGFAANSIAGANFLKNDLDVPADKIRVIRNAIKPARPVADRREWRSRLGANDEALVACMIGNLSSYKDHETLLRAWKQVLDSLKNSSQTVLLALAGRNDTKGEMLKLMAFDLELENTVKFLGHVDDISGLLGACDFAVFSSPSEGGPNGVFEPMSAGLAVAATDNPGVREALGPDGFELLAPAGDAEALAARILQLVNKPELRERVGQTNKAKINRDYKWEDNCKKTVEMIVEMLNQATSTSKPIAGSASGRNLDPNASRALEVRPNGDPAAL